jgi:hypothetical protein
MAVATYIAKVVLTCSPIGLLSYFILKPPCPVNPSDIFSKGPISYPCSSLLVTKKTKSLLGDFQRVLKSACVDFRSLHPVHPKFSPNSCFSGLIYPKDVSDLKSLCRRDVLLLLWC